MPERSVGLKSSTFSEGIVVSIPSRNSSGLGSQDVVIHNAFRSCQITPPWKVLAKGSINSDAYCSATSFSNVVPTLPLTSIDWDRALRVCGLLGEMPPRPPELP
jgi:hypothetical protein